MVEELDDSDEEYLARVIAFTKARFSRPEKEEKFIVKPNAKKTNANVKNQRTVGCFSANRIRTTHSQTATSERNSSSESSCSSVRQPNPFPFRCTTQVLVVREQKKATDHIQRPLMKKQKSVEPQNQPNTSKTFPQASSFKFRSQKLPADAIPIKHRSITSQPRFVAQSQQSPLKRQILKSTEDKKRANDVIMKSSDDVLEKFQRMRLMNTTNTVTPILGCPTPVKEQSTWLPEADHLDPNEPILASSKELTDEPVGAQRKECPSVFAELRIGTAEKDRAKPQEAMINLTGETVRAKPEVIIKYLGKDRPMITRIHLEIADGVKLTDENRPLLSPALTNSGTSRSSEARSETSNNFNTHSKYRNLERAEFLNTLNSEVLERMREEDVQRITYSFDKESLRIKFKETYPFMVEGIVQKDSNTNRLNVYSARLGKIVMEDNCKEKSYDYVRFMCVKQGLYRGFLFGTRPTCLSSTNCLIANEIIHTGYGILAHSFGQREESRWVLWNDSMGLMPVEKGAASEDIRNGDKQLEVVLFQAVNENHSFLVKSIRAIKANEYFPSSPFLVTDAIYKSQSWAGIKFFSKIINAIVCIDFSLVGSLEVAEGREYEMVVVPTFPRPDFLQFRAISIISTSAFWSRDKKWIRELLMKKTESYSC